MTYLLDSHVLLWAAIDEQRLSAMARDLIESPQNRLAVSVASLWELTLKYARGRLRLPEPVELFFDTMTRELDLEVVPVHQHHVAALVDLPEASTDPFDRMLVAQSLTEDMPLITADAVLREYPIEVIW